MLISFLVVCFTFEISSNNAVIINIYGRNTQQLLPFVGGVFLYVGNLSIALGRAIYEQMTKNQLDELVFVMRIRPPIDRDNIDAYVDLGNDLDAVRLISNVISGSLEYICEYIEPKSFQDSCETINSDLRRGLSSVAIREDETFLKFKVACINCLAYIYVLGATVDFMNISVTILEDSIDTQRDRFLKLGKLHTIKVTPEPVTIDAITWFSKTEIKTDFVPYHNFYLRLEFADRVRYVKQEYLVSELEVEMDNEAHFYYLDHGEMVLINLKLTNRYKTRYLLILESGGDILTASKPLRNLTVDKTGTFQVKFMAIYGPIRMPSFGSIKIRIGVSKDLAWQHVFYVSIGAQKPLDEMLYIANEISYINEESSYDLMDRDFALITKVDKLGKESRCQSLFGYAQPWHALIFYQCILYWL